MRWVAAKGYGATTAEALDDRAHRTDAPARADRATTVLRSDYGAPRKLLLGTLCGVTLLACLTMLPIAIADALSGRPGALTINLMIAVALLAVGAASLLMLVTILTLSGAGFALFVDTPSGPVFAVAMVLPAVAAAVMGAALFSGAFRVNAGHARRGPHRGWWKKS